MVFDEYSESHQEPYIDQYQEDAKPEILDIIYQHNVVTDRELKVRLEKKYFPWVTGQALESLVSDGLIKKDGFPGRPPRMGTPRNFYLNPEFDYWNNLGLIGRKRELTANFNALLTHSHPAGLYAETIFERAFISLGFEIKKRNASEFRGKKVVGVKGKKPPDIDFILKRGKKYYGVNIKNWIKFEKETIKEIILKIDVAKQLDVIPVICARYVDGDTIFKEIVSEGGFCYRYEQLLLPPVFRSLAETVIRYLGYPILVVDRLPSYKLEHLKSKVFKI